MHTHTRLASSLLDAARVALPVSAVCLAPEAAAQIVYTPITSNNTLSSGSSSLYVDLGDGLGGSGSVSIDSAPSGTDYALNFLVSDSSKPRISGQVSNGGGVENTNQFATNSDTGAVANFTLGALIDSASGTFATTMARLETEWGGSTGNTTTGYIGVRFFDAASDFHYGWIELTRGADLSLTVSGLAYNIETNASIEAGQTSAIPEPSTVGLAMALVAGSAAAYRRRRRTPAATTA